MDVKGSHICSVLDSSRCFHDIVCSALYRRALRPRALFLALALYDALMVACFKDLFVAHNIIEALRSASGELVRLSQIHAQRDVKVTCIVATSWLHRSLIENYTFVVFVITVGRYNLQAFCILSDGLIFNRDGPTV